MISFPGYRRRSELMKKLGLTPEERLELSELDTALLHFRREHPEWDPNQEPLRVSFLDAARFRPR